MVTPCSMKCCDKSNRQCSGQSFDCRFVLACPTELTSSMQPLPSLHKVCDAPGMECGVMQTPLRYKSPPSRPRQDIFPPTSSPANRTAKTLNFSNPQTETTTTFKLLQIPIKMSQSSGSSGKGYDVTSSGTNSQVNVPFQHAPRHPST